MSLGVLYSFRRCPYAMRARMALDAAGQEVELREIVLANKPPELLELSPKGTVPVLQLHGGTVLEESLDIMHWALAQSDPDAWLAMETPSLHETFIATNDGAFKHHLDRYKYATRYKDASPEKERQKACEFIAALESQLAQIPFLHGSKARLTDVALFPFMRQFASSEPERFAHEFPNTHRWLEGWKASERFLRIMKKLPVWSAGAQPVLFSQAFGR